MHFKNQNILSIDSSVELIPKNVPQAISGSSKYKHFLGDHTPNPQGSVSLHTIKFNDLAPLYFILTHSPRNKKKGLYEKSLKNCRELV